MRQRAMSLGEPTPPTMVGVMILLDRSGSMVSIRGAMEEALRAFLESQRGEPGDLWVSVHQFDAFPGTDLAYERLIDRAPIADVRQVLLSPRGDTPLRDALWAFATEARTIIDDPADSTERLLVVIITDGEETVASSHPWAAVRERLAGLRGADCELIWMGTSEAMLEAQRDLPNVAMPMAFARSAAGASYLSGGLTAAALGIRSGNSAYTAVADYMATQTSHAGSVPVPIPTAQFEEE